MNTPEERPWTEQTAFDAMLASMRARGYRRATMRSRLAGKPICVYKATDGARCHIGVLLSDEELGLVAKMECSVTSLLKEFTKGDLPSLESLCPFFLGDAQDTHDGCENNGAEYETAMKELAFQYELIYTPPETTPA